MVTQMEVELSRLRPQLDANSSEILVIEDEDLMSALISRYLDSSIIPGLECKPKVRVLDRGWDLLEADLSNVRVAIVDLLLPQITGIDLIRNFRTRYPKMGIVPISGMATAPMKRNLAEMLDGEFALIDKPLRRDNFTTAFLRAWNYCNIPPKSAPDESPAPGEPYWNAVSAQKTTSPIQVEKKRSLKKAS
jgi:DNA-binding NtrC family response regulator